MLHACLQLKHPPYKQVYFYLKQPSPLQDQLMTSKRLYYINTVQNVAIYVCQKVSNIYADPDTIT